MNPVQIQLNVILDSDVVVDLLVRAIEKGTSGGIATIIQIAQQRGTHEVETRAKSSITAHEPTQGDDDHQSVQAKLVDANAVAQMLGVSARMVWRLRDSGGIPKPVIIGRLVRWRSEAIEEWIQAGCPADERRGVKRRDVR